MSFWKRLFAPKKNRFKTVCPRCRKEFRGHEPHGRTVKFKKPDGSVEAFRIVCGACHKDALT